jgi:hypothetical protein
MSRTLRCQHCDGAIGSYEPMIVLTDGEVCRLSRARMQSTATPLGECYHLACHTVLARSVGWPASRVQPLRGATIAPKW